MIYIKLNENFYIYAYRGGFALVWLGVCRKTGQKYAVK